MFSKKPPKSAPPAKRKIVPDIRDYHITQPAEDKAALAKSRLETGVVVAGKMVSFKDGVLTLNPLKPEGPTPE